MQMYTVRGIVHKEDESATEENTGDDEDLYGGFQYSSEGEEIEFKEFHPMTYDDEDHHIVHLCALRTELQTANRYAALVEDETEDIEAWDLDDMTYLSASYNVLVSF